MMAAFILAFSLLTLLMFFVSYCRSLTASSSRHTLSTEVRDVTGIAGQASGRDYTRVMQLLRLCPDRSEDRPGIQAVRFYYGILNFLQILFARLLPSLNHWTEQERAGCASYAVVALDRRIAFSRQTLLQQGQF
jgi:hypothetical protein